MHINNFRQNESDRWKERETEIDAYRDLNCMFGVLDTLAGISEERNKNQAEREK